MQFKPRQTRVRFFDASVDDNNAAVSSVLRGGAAEREAFLCRLCLIIEALLGSKAQGGFN